MSKISQEKTVVGIGASAGGLEALRLLIPRLPVQVDIAYIIAQHLDPKHSSMLRDILARENDIKIKEIDHQEKLIGGVLYIIPPGKDAYLKNNNICLQSATGIGPKPSIDRLFISLSKEFSRQAVGIILSGTGSDGAHGIRAIKAEGGITIAQDERSAKFPSMPIAAVQTGHVDIILQPDKMGERLPSLIQYPRNLPNVAKENVEENDFLGKILLLVFNYTGSDFRDYKKTTIYRRIERRMAIHKIFSLEVYFKLLESNKDEINELYQDVLISVTDFFRDEAAFAGLKNYLPQVINEESREIRVWVCGCATGQEAYSIAILLAEYLGERIKYFNIQIFATDLDEKALVTARQGSYPKSLIEGIDEKIRDRYFNCSGERCQLKNNIRDMILFAKHNVIKDPPFSNLDLITCRNLLIYFNNNLQRRVLQLFHYALRTDKLLFLGKSETTGAYEKLFIPVERKERLYRKQSEVRSHIPPFNMGFNKLNGISEPHHTKVSRERQSPTQLLDERLMNIYSPNCVVLDELYNINYIRGDVQLYLKFNEGRVGLGIFDLIHPALRQELRGLLYKARREYTQLVRSRKLMMQFHGEHYNCYLEAKYYDKESEFIVLFSSAREVLVDTDSQDESLNKHLAARIKGLEDELREVSESLQTTIEELETSNEELQSTYEEAQSTNEELYTSTEELQTSNEELQSANEELRTLNEEINAKSIELEKTNDQLHNEVDQRTRAENELRLQERKLRRIIDTEPAWVNICNEQGEILDVNRAGLQMMEADHLDALLGKTLLDFALDDYKKDISNCYKNLSHKVPNKHLIKVKTCKDNIRWLEVNSVILPDESDEMRFISIIIDQTSYKKTERELLQRREELSHITRINTLGAMASSIAHEINQPLTAISSYISGCEWRLKQSSCGDEKLMETILQVRHQVSRAGDIVNHIKNFIKQDNSENIPLSINDTVNSALRLLKDAGQLANVKIVINLSLNLPDVMAKATQLEQVIVNFIMNAIEAMEFTKSPEIIIRTVLSESGDVMLSVQDNGVGIPLAQHEKIFKPFYTTKKDGMGMGLNISHSIIESYAGQCYIESLPEGGSIMSFTLPKAS